MHELSELLYLNGMQTIDALAALAHQREQGFVGQFDLIERIERIAGKIGLALGQSPFASEQSLSACYQSLFASEQHLAASEQTPGTSVGTGAGKPNHRLRSTAI